MAGCCVVVLMLLVLAAGLVAFAVIAGVAAFLLTIWYHFPGAWFGRTKKEG